jgi:hypothetical protein
MSDRAVEVVSFIDGRKQELRHEVLPLCLSLLSHLSNLEHRVRCTKYPSRAARASITALGAGLLLSLTFSPLPYLLALRGTPQHRFVEISGEATPSHYHPSLRRWSLDQREAEGDHGLCGQVSASHRLYVRLRQRCQRFSLRTQCLRSFSHRPHQTKHSRLEPLVHCCHSNKLQIFS